MAKGNKNYFRHSFSTSEDVKIQKLIDLLGTSGYYYFFSLCEIAAKQCIENDENPKTFYAKIHPRNLCSLWRIQRNKLEMVLKHLESSLGMLWKLSGNEVSYLICNLSKYLGRYDSSNDKGKERKLKERKEEEPAPEIKISDPPFLELCGEIKPEADQILEEKLTPKKVVEFWNSGASQHNLPKIQIGDYKLYNQISSKLKGAIKQFPKIEDWEKIFNIGSTKGFTKKDGGTFVPTLETIVRHYEKYYAESTLEPVEEIIDERAVCLAAFGFDIGG